MKIVAAGKFKTQCLAFLDELVRGWRDPREIQSFIELVEGGGLPSVPPAENA